MIRKEQGLMKAPAGVQNRNLSYFSTSSRGSKTQSHRIPHHPQLRAEEKNRALGP